MSASAAVVSDALIGVAERYLAEQRRARRWGAVWRVVVAVYFGGLLGLWVATSWDRLWVPYRPHAAVVQVKGLISADSASNAERIGRGLRAAYANARVQAVVLEIDSPGGSPVQAERIYGEIRR